MAKRVHVVGAYNYANSELDVFTKRGDFVGCTRPEDADILVLMGGADINPQLYGERPVTGGHYNDRRDQLELNAIKSSPQSFKFGICRGGQLLNVLAGGTLWQDVNNHFGSHSIIDIKTGQRLITSSVHHQAFRTTDKAEIIATCQRSTHKRAQFKSWNAGVQPNKDDINDGVDIEVCYYAESRALCIQGHPEYGDESFADYCFNLMLERI